MKDKAKSGIWLAVAGGGRFEQQMDGFNSPFVARRGQHMFRRLRLLLKLLLPSPAISESSFDTP
jgi:hypothetical protein